VRLPAGVRFIERDWLSSNMVLIAEPDGGATLIDSGYVKHAALVVALVEHALGQVGAQRLSRVVNTHLHSDHCGGNAALVSRFGCEVLVPAGSFDDVQRWDTEALSYDGTAQRCARFEASGVLVPGESIMMGGAPWQIHSAPGHDPKSLVFYCAPHRLLVSADVLGHNGFGVILPNRPGCWTSSHALMWTPCCPVTARRLPTRTRSSRPHAEGSRRFAPIRCETHATP
jgi:glyoxylase-like metal-dependent hydrolase (beta-lactamase superfamily II)